MSSLAFEEDLWGFKSIHWLFCVTKIFSGVQSHPGCPITRFVKLQLILWTLKNFPGTRNSSLVLQRLDHKNLMRFQVLTGTHKSSSLNLKILSTTFTKCDQNQPKMIAPLSHRGYDWVTRLFLLIEYSYYEMFANILWWSQQNVSWVGLKRKSFLMFCLAPKKSLESKLCS